MKKTITLVIIAIIIGFSLGIIFFKRIDLSNTLIVSNMNNQVYAIQVGVYKNKDNALETSNKYKGIVISEEDYFRVYIDIVRDNEVKIIILKYLDELGISYYVKAINVSEEFSRELGYYEEMLLKTSKDNYRSIMESILKEYEKYL